MNKSEYEILFFTYSDKKYQFFAIPYAYFALKNIIQTHLSKYVWKTANPFIKNKLAINLIDSIYPGRTIFRQSKIVVNNPHVALSTVRFVEFTRLKSIYLYIGYINLLISTMLKKSIRTLFILMINLLVI